MSRTASAPLFLRPLPRQLPNQQPDCRLRQRRAVGDKVQGHSFNKGVEAAGGIGGEPLLQRLLLRRIQFCITPFSAG